MIWKPEDWLPNADSNRSIYLQREVKDTSPIGNFGASDIRQYLLQLLIGFEKQSRELLILGNKRIDFGLNREEYNNYISYPAQHRFEYNKARAIGFWLEENDLSEDHWNEARRFLEAWWRNPASPWTRQEILASSLDEYMAMSVLGGNFEDYKHGLDPFRAGIEMYEYWLGKPNLDLKRRLKPRDFAYLLCRHYLNGELDRDELVVAGRRMLRSKLATEWLDRVEMINAAMWLMLVYWYPAFHYHEDRPDPVEVLLRAYDDCPDVVRPF